jgi:hypothetical protein
MLKLTGNNKINRAVMQLLKFISKKPRLDTWLGRALYGNLSSFSYNTQGRLNLRHSRAQAPSATGLMADFLQSMAVHGYFRLPSPVSGEVLQYVRAEYLAALADPLRSTSIMSSAAQQAGLPTYCRAIDANKVPALDKLVAPEFDVLIQAFFGAPPKVTIGCARRTEYVEPDIAQRYDIYSNSWHCDNEPSDRIKLFIALNEIGPDNGPLHLLPRPRTREILKSGFKSRDEYGIPIETIEDPRHLVKFTGPAGSAIFVNVTQCLHRAGVPAQGYHRDIAEYQFRNG